MNGVTKEDIQRAFRTLRKNNTAMPVFSGTAAMVGWFLRYYYAHLPDELRREADEILASNEAVRQRFMEEAR